MPASTPPPRYSAVLLLGPTGAGKTPFGELLETAGWRNRRCIHFDFGMALRNCVASSSAANTATLLTADEIAFLKRVLESGALLEDEHFPIARKVLLDFLAARGATPETIVVLNGLPRHVGQAEAMDGVVAMETVIHLSCTPEVVVARIRSNSGGDRAGRSDDEIAAVRKRIETFSRRTEPLLAYYRTRGVPIVAIAVGPTTTPQEMLSGCSTAGVSPSPAVGRYESLPMYATLATPFLNSSRKE
jgi:adenylate kinase family enzyme